MIRFSDKHPAVTAVYFFAVTGFAMFVPHPAVLILSLFGAICYCLLSERVSFGFFATLVGLAVLMTLLNPLISHRGENVLFFINERPFTLEALLYGANAALLAVGVIVRMRSFSRIMTTEKLLCLVGRLSPRLAAVISMSVRSVPLFAGYYRSVSPLREINRKYDAEPTLPDRIKNSLDAFSATAGLALEGSIDAADSMDARGWQSNRRASSSRFSFGSSDAAVLLPVVAATALCIAAAAAGYLDFEFYPVISATYGAPFTLTSLAVYALLSFYPAISEAAWIIMWKKRTADRYPGAEALREFNQKRKAK